MKARAGVISTLTIAVFAGLAATCDSPATNLPTTPSTPSIVSVEVGGPSSVSPGQSAQFSAVVRLSNGTTKLATESVQWSTSNSSVLRVNASGLATAVVQEGEATLRVTVQTVAGIPASGSRTSIREVVILPDGTYRLAGMVTDAEFPGIPIIDARVEVVGGISAATGFDGRYRLYGVPPEAEVRVTKAGYHPQLQTVQLTAHTTQNFPLSLAGTRLDLGGRYALTIEVNGCLSARPLPSDLQRRTYDAFVTQTGPVVEVTLTEPRFRLNGIGRGSRFTGRAEPAGAVFTLQEFLSGYYGYSFYGPPGYPNVAERLSDGTHLVMSGTASTTGSRATGFSGTLSGRMDQWDSRFPTVQSLLTACPSSTHRFTLTPQ